MKKKIYSFRKCTIYSAALLQLLTTIILRLQAAKMRHSTHSNLRNLKKKIKIGYNPNLCFETTDRLYWMFTFYYLQTYSLTEQTWSQSVCYHWNDRTHLKMWNTLVSVSVSLNIVDYLQFFQQITMHSNTRLCQQKYDSNIVISRHLISFLCKSLAL